VTLAGWDGHSQSPRPSCTGVVVLDQPVTVSLDPKLNTPQSGTSGATITVTGDATPHQARRPRRSHWWRTMSRLTRAWGRSTVQALLGLELGDQRPFAAALAGQPLSGDLWYHPSYGIVAFTSPEIGLGLKMTDTSDCGAPDSDGFAIVRKVGIVDSDHPFKVSTYDDCSQQFDADKNEHAKMLLELRWADDSKAKAAVSTRSARCSTSSSVTATGISRSRRRRRR